MKGPIALFSQTLIAMITLWVCATAHAASGSYYVAVQHVKDKRYSDAEDVFRTVIRESQNQPSLVMRSKAWLALTLLAEDPKSAEAENLMTELVCSAAHLQSTNQLLKVCKEIRSAQPKYWQPETQSDFDAVNSAITTVAAMQWHKGEYQHALDLMNLSLLQSMNAQPSKNRLQALNSQNVDNAQTVSEQLASGQIKQALIKQQMKDQMLNKISNNMEVSEDDMKAVLQEHQKALVESLMAEVIAKQQMPNKKREKNQEISDKKLARIAASEHKVFRRLASKMSCQALNDDGEEMSVQSIHNNQLSFIAGALEAFKGQGIQSFKIIQRPTLKSLNTFLDTQQQFLAKEKTFIGNNDKISRAALDCFKRLKLQQHISQALLVALVRPARPHRSEKYLKQVIDTARRLRASQRFSHSSMTMEAAIEHYVLGTFYLQSNQKDQAIIELDQAFSLVNIEPQLIASPEMVYLGQIFRAKILQSMTPLAEPPSPISKRLQNQLAVLQQDAEQLKNNIARQLSLTPEQAQQAQLDHAKQLTGSLLQGEDIKSMMQKVDSLVASANSDKGSPSAKLSEIANMINSGAMDKKILELQKQMESQSPIQQEDVLGLDIEREYQFYNNHALLLLQLVNIQLDLNNKNAAREQFAKANAYTQEFAFWVGRRTQGYLQYTQARVFENNRQFEKASTAYMAAVSAWYFTPRSSYQILWNPLIYDTEILERAATFEISQNDATKAFSYLELARDVGSDKIDLYGSLTSEGLANEDRSLQQKLAELTQLAEQKAKQQGDLEAFNTAMANATLAEQASHRNRLDKNYQLLRGINAITAWLDPAVFAPFVDALVQQISRRQSHNLHQKRIDFLYQQQSLVSSASLNFHSFGQQKLGADLAAAVQQKIAQGSLLLSVWMGQTSTYIIALDKNDIRAHQVASEPLLHLVKAFNVALKPQHGVLVYEKLLEPYLNRPYTSIISIANGPLRNTPVAALKAEQNGRRWLGDQYLLRTVPTARQLLAQASKQSAKQVLVLDGSAVPGEEVLATSEVAVIKEMYSATHLVSGQLTKNNLLEKMPEYSVVHFAGHSKVNDEFPDFSYLALFNERVYALELEQLSLAGMKLLVLGSCESAAHADSALGNEFSSLQESFLTAGADAVVANLFPVNDQVASDFMAEFYKHLAKGLPKDHALQLAQQYIRTSKPNPKDWAGFVLSGSESPL